MAPYDPTSDITKKKALVTSCIRRKVEAVGIDSPKLDMKATQARCIQNAFPDVDEDAAKKSYAELIAKSGELEAEALRVSHELEAVMRFTMDEGPTKEVNKAARKECLKTLGLEIEVGDYLSYVTEHFKKGNLDEKKKIDACTYKTSIIGKWIRERQMLIRECALEAQKKLPENLQSDLKVLYALQLNTTALETSLSCSEREESTIIDGPTGPSGVMDVYCTVHGKAPKECQHCASQVYTTVDAATVEKEVDSCYIKKEAVNPLYKEYIAYMKKVVKRKRAIRVCLVKAAGVTDVSRFKADVMKTEAPDVSTKQAT
ncbi:uncharacterized protein LOC135401165 [Ornithodoros turicata]|uniref:uncharacterized protein LOC135401165 n=1 Tax=Ornithodoros turicata TaxID=34597 RepID=UPI0031396AFD